MTQGDTPAAAFIECPACKKPAFDGITCVACDYAALRPQGDTPASGTLSQRVAASFDALNAKIAALDTERLGWKLQCEAEQSRVKVLQSELQAEADKRRKVEYERDGLVERLAELELYAGRLREYARHKQRCDKLDYFDERATECTCGLAAALGGT